MSNAKYDKEIYMAMLAEQCYRYDEMVEFLTKLIKNKDSDIGSDERNLLSIAYKNSISGSRAALRTILAYREKERKKESSTFLPYIKDYAKEVADDLSKKCTEIIKFIDSELLKKASTDEAKVFYIKMKGDYNRYMAEYLEGDEKTKIADEAKKAYTEATECAASLDKLNPIALGLALNYSVFYYEVLNNHAEAIKIASDALKEAEPNMKNIDEEDEENKDTVSIVNLLKENLEMWKSEDEDNQD